MKLIFTLNKDVWTENKLAQKSRAQKTFLKSVSQMKRPAETLTGEDFTMEILKNRDLLNLIVIGRLSPSDVIHFSLTSKHVLEVCRTNAIWQPFVGGITRQYSSADEMYCIFQNLARGSFLNDTSFPNATFSQYRKYVECCAVPLG